MKKHILKLMRHDAFRFLIVGGCSTSVDFCIYMLLTEKIPVTVAKAISIGAGSLVSYFFNRYWTFKNKDKKKAAYLVRFYAGFSVAMATNLCVNYFVFRATGMKILAYIAATAYGTIINYIGQKYFVFRKVPNADSKE